MAQVIPDGLETWMDIIDGSVLWIAGRTSHTL
jgi:hypothetical protein